MTDAELADIEARARFATEELWTANGKVAAPGQTGGGGRAAFDLARRDVPALIAEVRRLRAALGMSSQEGRQAPNLTSLDLCWHKPSGDNK